MEQRDFHLGPCDRAVRQGGRDERQPAAEVEVEMEMEMEVEVEVEVEVERGEKAPLHTSRAKPCRKRSEVPPSAA